MECGAAACILNRQRKENARKLYGPFGDFLRNERRDVHWHLFDVLDATTYSHHITCVSAGYKTRHPPSASDSIATTSKITESIRTRRIQNDFYSGKNKRDCHPASTYSKFWKGGKNDRLFMSTCYVHAPLWVR